MSQTPKYGAVLRISAEALAVLLRLPARARITGISPHLYFSTGEYGVRVESSDPGCLYPQVREGSQLVTMRPVFRHDEKTDTLVLEGWEQ